MLAAYAGVVLAAAARPTTGGERRSRTVPRAAVPLAFGGYPVGRALMCDASPGPPGDGLASELLALGLVVPVAEELAWGHLVEDELGVAATSLLFALKHWVVDGRWRRMLGLAAFWAGLGGIRRAHPERALGVHVACNTAAVLLGHATGRDQF